MATKQEMCRSNVNLTTDLGIWERANDPHKQLFNVVGSRCPLQVARHASPTVTTTELKNNLPDGAIITKVRHWPGGETLLHFDPLPQHNRQVLLAIELI